MASLKVLILGGRQCGKTSLLASIFDSMRHGNTNEFLSACDKTQIKDQYLERQQSLLSRRLNLEHIINKRNNSTFCIRYAPDHCYWNYILELRIPGTSKRMDVEFLDVPGSFLKCDSSQFSYIASLVNEFDVIIVVVDTPYLMADCKEVVVSANAIHEIQYILMQIDSQDTRKAKQILFAPVKCERWIKDGKIDEVTRKIEEIYSTTIQDFMASSNNEISIIPVETAGDIIFSEFKDPYILLNNQTISSVHCAKISDRIVLFTDGKMHRITEDETLVADPGAVFDPWNEVIRPDEWFHLRNAPKATYSPHNCEQLLLHIIRYKYLKATLRSSWFGTNSNNVFFGNILLNDIADVLGRLSQANMIKDSGEGIKVLRT